MTISSIGSDHIERISQLLGTFLIDPAKSGVQYFFPCVAAFFSNHQELRSDPSLSAAMPPGQTDLMLREIEELTRCASVQVTPYVALNHTFFNAGGAFSITKPAIFIPEQYLFRRQASPFPQERAEDNLALNPWVFTDDEVRFFIARELGQIQESSSLLKLAIKVAILAAFFMIYATPWGWTGGSVLFIGALGLYILSERIFQARADLSGVAILRRRGIANPTQIAIRALQKQIEQNRYRRENSSFARFFILESGDHLLDFMHPFLTTRIERLRNCEENS